MFFFSYSIASAALCGVLMSPLQPPPPSHGFERKSMRVRIVRIKFQIECPELTYRCIRRWNGSVCEKRTPVYKWHPASSEPTQHRSHFFRISIYHSRHFHAIFGVWIDEWKFKITLIVSNGVQQGCRQKQRECRRFWHFPYISVCRVENGNTENSHKMHHLNAPQLQQRRI